MPNVWRGSHKVRLVQTKPKRRRRSQTRLGHHYDVIVPEQLVPGRLVVHRSRIQWGKVPSALLLVAALALLFAFWIGDDFYVSSVRITGTRLVSAEEIFTAAGLKDKNIFLVRTGDIQERLYKAFPSIQSVSVRCQLPGQVIIQVVEREPKLIWHTRDAAFLVDGEGKVLQWASGLESGNDLHVYDLDNVPLRPGDMVDASPVRTVIALHDLMPEVRRFDYTAERGISIMTAQGWRAYFGNDEALETKVNNLKSMLDTMVAQGVQAEYIDLRFVSSPYYR